MKLIDNHTKIELDEHVDVLVKKILPIFEKFIALQEQAAVMGMFTNQRDLAECAHCQLFEDVTAQGILIVYRGEKYNEDTGLRFRELADNALQCSSCSIIFCLKAIFNGSSLRHNFVY